MYEGDAAPGVQQGLRVPPPYLLREPGGGGAPVGPARGEVVAQLGPASGGVASRHALLSSRWPACPLSLSRMGPATVGACAGGLVRPVPARRVAGL